MKCETIRECRKKLVYTLDYSTHLEENRNLRPIIKMYSVNDTSHSENGHKMVIKIYFPHTICAYKGLIGMFPHD